MALDTRIGEMRIPFDGALQKMAEITNLAHAQAMAPYQFQAAALANQRQQQALDLANKLAPYQTQGASLANKRQQQALNLASQMNPLEVQKARLMAQYPLLNLPGVAGQVGAALYAQNNPQLMQNVAQTQRQLPLQPVQQQAQQLQPRPVMNQQPSGLLGLTKLPQQGQQPQQSLPLKPVLTPSQNGMRGQQSPSPSDLIMRGIQNAQDLQEAKSKFYTQRVSGAGWFSLNPDRREQDLAVAQAMGYQPEEAANLFAKGNTLQDLANAKGLDLKKIDPSGSYAATSKTRSFTQAQQMAIDSLSALSKHVVPALANYAQQIDGISPLLLKQELSGQNPDDQARYIAARALQPEIAAARIRAAGGNVSEKLLADVQRKTVGRLGNFQSLVSPEVFAAAQKYIDQWLGEAAQAGRRGVLNPAQASSQGGADQNGAEDLIEQFRSNR